MLLRPGLVSVADTHRRTWTEMGMSVVRDTKSIDAIDCCWVVTCPQHTYTHTHVGTWRCSGWGVIEDTEGVCAQGRIARRIQIMPLWQSTGMVAVVKSGAGGF